MYILPQRKIFVKRLPEGERYFYVKEVEKVTVRTYSKHAAAMSKASAHFKVTEFACNDGSDKILIDDKLVELLEFIRNYFNAPVIITSAYRTAAYNKKVGGSPNSQHLKGTAADIIVSGVEPSKVVTAAELFLGNSGGIGLYGISGFTHVDTRANASRWYESKRGQVAVRVRFSVAPAKVDDEMVETSKIIVDGKEIAVNRILKDGTNYIKIRDVGDALGYIVSAIGSVPVLTKK